jgi:hypothetical protein
MHDQPTLTPAEQERQLDHSVLMLLTHDPGLWTMDEISRALGDRVGAVDGVSHLFADGLIHRLDGFVFATRAALRAQRLAL